MDWKTKQISDSIGIMGKYFKGNSLYNTMKILTTRGFVVNGGAELVAKHSFIVERIPITETFSASGDLLNYVGKKLISLDSITVPLQKESMQIKIMRLFPGGSMPRRIVKLKINKSLCNQCGNCIRKCPTGAIGKITPLGRIDVYGAYHVYLIVP